jgi:hypothetical protein
MVSLGEFVSPETVVVVLVMVAGYLSLDYRLNV